MSLLILDGNIRDGLHSLMGFSDLFEDLRDYYCEDSEQLENAADLTYHNEGA